MKSWLTHIALAGLIVAVALTWARNELDPSPFQYDEADYVYAASQGFLANWSDTPALTLPEFLRIGLTRGRDSRQQSDLSAVLRDSGDMNGYRHWHGPLFYYGLSAAARISPGEYGLRAIALAAPLLGVFIIYGSCLWLWPGPRGALAGTLSTALFLWSPAVVRTTELAPHLFHVVVCMASTACLAKMRASGRREHWYLALLFAGLAFVTMELTFALVLAALICGYLERARLQPDFRFAARSLAAFLTPVVLLWPASLYKLTAVKSYLVMAYLAVFRRGAWGVITFLDTWKIRVAAMPVEWTVLAVALTLYAFRKNLSGRREASAFLIYGVSMLAAVLPVRAESLRYMIPFFPSLMLFAGCVLTSALWTLRPSLRWSLAAALGLALFLDTARQVNQQPRAPDAHLLAILAEVRDHNWTQKTLLVSQIDLPTLHYYFPRARLRGYLDPADIPQRLRADSFDGVISAK